ncbi:MAG TPA: YggS family pyridoxal phosphate-dependent enzyme [Candidatus Avibacteroides faecavium]|nr:YggS family pyridoxal phosphate-dependent enzyme [Candidatus Avibacteroides faecavium]
MSSIADNIRQTKASLPDDVTLVAVSKFKSCDDIMEAYGAGQRVFGESRALELRDKHEALPKDIQWHFIGHLQTNKIKYIIPFVTLIHSIDSLKLLEEVDAQARNHGRSVDCLLQVHISQEETKFGFTYDECRAVLKELADAPLANVNVVGLMGMATYTDDMDVVRNEFAGLKAFFEEARAMMPQRLSVLSMGMSEDYEVAVQEGTTMVRIGSKIFGLRN